ncbi:MAG: DUF4340 domain-containing protein [Deltaproteobacteria bacterium]|nr:DUF4340 domain-containing protein [Deltaproteobacteria bacterium]
MNKSTLIAVVVFVALLVGALAVLREKPERGMERLSFATIEVDDVTRIETKGEKGVELKKEGDLWKLADGKRADRAAIQRLLVAVPKIQSSTVVTRNPERFAELEVDDAKGTTVVAAAGDRELAEFVVGKSARGGTHIRVGDDVFAVRGVYPSEFVRDAWYEKKLFDVKPEDVEKIEIALADGTTYALVRKEQDWAIEDPSVLPAGFRFDPAQAKVVANQAIFASAGEVLDADPGDEKTGLGGATDAFTLVGKDGKRQTLRLGGEDENKHVYARADGWNEVVTVSPSTGKALRKGPSDLRDLTLMSFTPADVVALDIVSGKDSIRFERDEDPSSWRIAKSSEKEPEGFRLDPNRVTQRIATVRSTRAASVAPASNAADASAAGLEKASGTVTVTTKDGASSTMTFGADTKQNEVPFVFVRGNVDGETYLIADFTRDSLTGGLSTFEYQEPPPGAPGGLGGIDPAQLQNLPPEVRESLMKQIMEQQRQQALGGGAPPNPH